jgi:hypothetical protein
MGGKSCWSIELGSRGPDETKLGHYLFWTNKTSFVRSSEFLQAIAKVRKSGISHFASMQGSKVLWISKREKRKEKKNG